MGIEQIEPKLPYRDFIDETTKRVVDLLAGGTQISEDGLSRFEIESLSDTGVVSLDKRSATTESWARVLNLSVLNDRLVCFTFSFDGDDSAGYVKFEIWQDKLKKTESTRKKGDSDPHRYGLSTVQENVDLFKTIEGFLTHAETGNFNLPELVAAS